MAMVEQKQIYEIASLLMRKISIKDWTNYGDRVGINSYLLELDGNDLSKWKTIVKSTIKSNDNTQLCKLLEIVLVDYPDERLNELLGELQTGYTSRLQKLVKAIKYRQCILFLGPNALIDINSKKSFNHSLAGKFEDLLSEKGKYYDERLKDNLNYMVQRYNKTCEAATGEVQDIATRFYKTLAIDKTVFEELSKLPWDLIINTNPDTLLAEEMKKKDPNSCIINSYPLTNNIDRESNKSIPENNQCLFYNIFGTFDELASILFTDSDFIRFNTKISTNKPRLNEYATGMFDSTKELLFLGFDFDQWYFKILFKTLDLGNGKAFSIHPFPGNDFNECNVDYFEGEYKFYFVKDNMSTFLRKIVDCYKSIE